MPVLPTYEEQEGIDPGRMQPVALDKSRSQAAANLGAALQGIGGNIEEMAGHIQKRQDQQDQYSAGLQYDGLRQDVQTALDTSKQNMPADGQGFAPGFALTADQLVMNRLARVPESQQGRFLERWGVEREKWQRQATDAQITQARNNDAFNLNNGVQEDLKSINLNPSEDTLGSVLGNRLAQIDNSPNLTSAEKLSARQNVTRQLQYTYLATRYATDPDGMARELHLRGLDGSGAAGGPGVLPSSVPPSGDPSLPAGMRNNNPGNIKFVGTGQAPGVVGPSRNTDQGDPQAVFRTQQDGMNAAAALLLRKFDGGKTTVNALVAERGGWTPGNYAAARNIAATAGVAPDQPLDLSRNPQQFGAVMRGLLTQEHGPASRAYGDDMIGRAIAVAQGRAPAGGAAAASVAPAPAQSSAPAASVAGAQPAAASAPTDGQMVIGDSLGVGLAQAGKAQSVAFEGINPSAVANNIAKINPTQLAGKQIVLSSGASNAPQQADLLGKQIDTLVSKGVDPANIRVVGVGTRDDFAKAGLNDKLAAIAKSKGAVFTGPLDPNNLAEDQVHLKDYNKGLGQIASVAGPAPASPVASTADAVWGRMIGAESGGNPSAVSPKGALGVAQLEPSTAREMATQAGMQNVAGMSDAQLRTFFAAHPDINEHLGRVYFNNMLARYGGDVQAAAVAYNAGPVRADQFVQSGHSLAVLPAETRDYVQKVAPTAALAPSGAQAALGAAPVAKDQADSPQPEGVFTRGDAGQMRPQTGTGPYAGANNGALMPYLAKGKPASSVTNLNQTFAGRIAIALQNAPPEVRAGTVIGSGFRDEHEQAAIYAKAQEEHGDSARQWAAPPGHSNHNRGLAVDLGFGNDAARQWWHQNAASFGLKFPLANEDWHIEPQETRGGATYKDGGVVVGGAGAALHPVGAAPVPMGGTPNPRYSSLSFDDTQKLLAGAAAGQQRVLQEQHQAAVTDSYNTQQLVNDDVASLKNTGMGAPNLDPNRVMAVLGPQKFQEWKDKQGTALDTFRGMAGMDSMSNDALEGHAEQFRPTAADAGEGYGRKAAVYQAVHDHAQEILEQRAKDPAAAVATAPNVRAAQAALAGAGNSLAARENLVAARYAAQDAVGVLPSNRSPITADEAKNLASRLRPLSRGQAEVADQEKIIGDTVGEINQRYGRFAPDVLRQVMYATTLKQDAADVLAEAITNLQTKSSGPLVPAQSGARLSTSAQADAIARQSGAAVPAASAMPAGAAPGAPGAPRAGFDQAIDLLRKNPTLMPMFVQRYGADRVPVDMRPKPQQGATP